MRVYQAFLVVITFAPSNKAISTASDAKVLRIDTADTVQSSIPDLKVVGQRFFRRENSMHEDDDNEEKMSGSPSKDEAIREFFDRAESWNTFVHTAVKLHEIEERLKRIREIERLREANNAGTSKTKGDDAEKKSRKG
ncbi:unnamed protein product [Peronospora belbahrii]|uniref:RxLR effector protein n=1 Tax=Peronospora belbahrii TaxID=622444 RepID=A0ABN8DC85_9STRA|nr:unnamed protein product [Peronospora belbahrii]